ncbi:Catechol 2,3-dioxygenase [Duganella sacchari]|uniref:Catechol 2,3-dioxygenase n=1 Tax=Duganella sacchari TaxID=551987 RepID=A0A1M7I6X0_9BURK|nr:VOC family protein [Duganella sacchari]SHM36521.1 Catechol 2,3-dioxygenase [Duganella sacchari]
MSPDYVLLYVDNPAASGEFYADLLNVQPVETSPTFVLFVLPSGLKLGLWSRHTAEPTVQAFAGGSELAFAVPDRSVVNDMYADWSARGLAIAQRPVAMDFGFTFVALDRDGHRLRVLALEN